MKNKPSSDLHPLSLLANLALFNSQASAEATILPQTSASLATGYVIYHPHTFLDSRAEIEHIALCTGIR